MPPSNAEIYAVLSVLWHTSFIRSSAEDHALLTDEAMWKRNGGLFPNFARYHSQKWKEMMGPDDPSVRGRRISGAAMVQARQNFERSALEPIIFALELVNRIRTAVSEAIDQNGPSDDGEYEEEVGMKAWEEIASDPR